MRRTLDKFSWLLLAAVLALASLLLIPAGARASLLLIPPPEPETGSPPVKKISITAQRFHFSPARIEAEAGTRLEIRLRSRDTVHGFHIVGTDVNVLVPARGRGTVTAVFDAPEPGRYEFECSKKCGAGHTQMRGIITVKDSSQRGEKNQ